MHPAAMIATRMRQEDNRRIRRLGDMVSPIAIGEMRTSIWRKLRKISQQYDHIGIRLAPMPGPLPAEFQSWEWWTHVHTPAPGGGWLREKPCTLSLHNYFVGDHISHIHSCMQNTSYRTFLITTRNLNIFQNFPAWRDYSSHPGQGLYGGCTGCCSRR